MFMVSEGQIEADRSLLVLTLGQRLDVQLITFTISPMLIDSFSTGNPVHKNIVNKMYYKFTVS